MPVPLEFAAGAASDHRSLPPSRQLHRLPKVRHRGMVVPQEPALLPSSLNFSFPLAIPPFLFCLHLLPVIAASDLVLPALTMIQKPQTVALI
jgi:hypothetical protein